MNLGPYCVYCLAGARRNTQTFIEVQTRPGPPVLEVYRGSKAPRELVAWLAKQEAESGGTAKFVLDGLFGAFQIATTWHGDPVCEIHMVELVRP